ncbi:MAG: 3-deoxy-manno-octulosonate cytidylyltransferase [Salinivirgaceae bacterium]|nr:3-deoxy-manno-octulosonate cytidylyltransferase [Salinivirgaceae bacterium]
MVILGIIPARYASTRFPGKPLADIAGKPMVQRVFEQASKALEHVVVATDDQRIYDAVQAFGGKVVMTSDRHPSGTDRCAEAVIKFEQDYHQTVDVVINIQGDEPFIAEKQINLLANLFNDSNVQIATLVKPVDDEQTLFNPNKPKVVVDKNGRALLFSRQTIPHIRGSEPQEWLHKHPFLQHIGMYGYRKDILLEITRLAKSSLESAESLEQLRWLENGYQIQTAVTTDEGLSVDTPEDLEQILKLFKNK